MGRRRDGVPPPPVFAEPEWRKVWPPRLVSVWDGAWRAAQMIGWRWLPGNDGPEFFVRFNEGRRNEAPYVWVEASRVRPRQEHHC